ncbi:hypothetical protein E1091_00330 [Micromonospora fluostatini]|uniref:Uncharacterized protein n=1 Tax=Micromonospora fluostatini TaxID=1629071 RepID=A0ABY2DPE7_9ACTN|nr:hypothetical protein E1091_00330 [Micromonospora fluostatini]
MRELQAGRRLERATIGDGGLTVTGTGGVNITGSGRVGISGDGRLVLYAPDGSALIVLGRLTGFGDGIDRSGLAAWRTTANGGTLAMSLYDGIWAVWDRAGNVVLSTDENSGQGLGRPWLPVTWAGSDYEQWPGTTSGTFTQLCETALPKQQPRLFARIRHTTDVSGTTGQIRLMCNGEQLGPTTTVTFAIGYVDIGPLALPTSGFGDILGLSVDGRRTAGTGRVRATVTASWTQQS